MRKSLLFVSQSLPFPPHQPDAAARVEAQRRLAEYITTVYEPTAIPAERSRMRRLGVHLRSVATARPYTYYEYHSRKFGQILRRALAETCPALVHLDSLDLYGWLPQLPGMPVAVTHHSVESDLLRSRARHIKSRGLGAYLRFQANRVEVVERRLCNRLALNVMMSETDAAKLAVLAPGSRMVTVPNGVNTDYFKPQPDSAAGQTVTFLGPTYMYPNRDAVDWFLEEMWGHVRAHVPGAVLHLIGKNSPADRARYERQAGVRCWGYVPDVRPHLAAASCSIVPIRIGGGTRLKILDSWAMGIPVVTTSVGCEGLQATDGDNTLIRDDPRGFARAVIDLLVNPTLRSRLAVAGRRTAEVHYDWSVIGDRLIGAYHGAIENPYSKPAAAV
jgi:glycosyltransferase involved in cell wall biosynthesis